MSPSTATETSSADSPSLLIKLLRKKAQARTEACQQILTNLASALPLFREHTIAADTVHYIILQRAEDDTVYQAEVQSSPDGIRSVSCGPADDVIDGMLLELAGVGCLILAIQRFEGALRDLPLERKMAVRKACGGADGKSFCLLVA